MRQPVVLPQENGGTAQMSGKKSAFGGIGTGMLSVLMVLIVLLLTAFSVLSYSTAIAEARLTEKTVLSAEDYYAADAAAQQLVFQLYTLAEEYDSAESFFENLPETSEANISWEPSESGEGYQLTCTVPIDDARQLRILLQLIETDGALQLSQTQRRTESTAVWEEEGIYIWDGN